MTKKTTKELHKAWKNKQAAKRESRAVAAFGWAETVETALARAAAAHEPLPTRTADLLPKVSPLD